MVPTMNNLIVSYDINRPSPTHHVMDQHMMKAAGTVSRILETVWMVHTSWTANQLFDYVNKLLTNDDRLMVVDARDMVFRNLLKPDGTIKQQWNALPVAAPGLGLGIRPSIMTRSLPSSGIRPQRRF